MQDNNFHSEWITINKHRILLQCRKSFPDEEMKLIARIAVETCDHNSGKDARVVKIYFDDKVSMTTITIASTNPDDKNIEEHLRKVFEMIFNSGNFNTLVEIVKQGNSFSDNYDHMQYLSSMAGVIK